VSSAHFQVTHRDPDTSARCATLQTAHGAIQTPVFMPVGTQATVKTLSSEDVKQAGAQIILSNAYHLYLRPGVDCIEAMGGLHRFMGWNGPILTDSGGFQIFSLKEKKKLTTEGLEFKSHLDGSKHFLTPERVVEIETRLGVDILMPLDECIPYPADEARAHAALKLTQLWLERSKAAWLAGGKPGSHLFSIIQGGVHPHLRREAAQRAAELDLPGNAIGGLSVGEPQDEMCRMLEVTVPEMPENRPRYLMGVGYPDDLLLAVERGVDMFDCVAPTRNGRNGTLFTSRGKLLIRNAEFARDEKPLDPDCACPTCRSHSRAYLRHLFQAKEILAQRLASLHNIAFFIQLLERARFSIQAGSFLQFKNQFFKQYREGTKS